MHLGLEEKMNISIELQIKWFRFQITISCGFKEQPQYYLLWLRNEFLAISVLNIVFCFPIITVNYIYKKNPKISLKQAYQLNPGTNNNSTAPTNAIFVHLASIR